MYIGTVKNRAADPDSLNPDTDAVTDPDSECHVNPDTDPDPDTEPDTDPIRIQCFHTKTEEKNTDEKFF
jgi:hypothetical protein